MIILFLFWAIILEIKDYLTHIYQYIQFCPKESDAFNIGSANL